VTTTGTVRLLDVEPDLGRYLTDADVEGLDGLPVPAVGVAPGDLDVRALLAGRHAFGAVVLEGLIIVRLAVGEAATLRVIGPGDMLGIPAGLQSTLVADRGWRASGAVRLALLERAVLLAAHRAPRIVAGLHARSSEQADRVAVQLAICQLPRVEDRVLALLWLLAETWGQVTAHGTALRLHLTHETIGGLVGARRSTVTLALGQLTDDGAILRQDRGWLLLAPPVPAVPGPTAEAPPELLDPLPERVERPVTFTPSDVAGRLEELQVIRDDLANVREVNRRRVERELSRLRESRRVSHELREQARGYRELVARLHHDNDAGNGLGSMEGQTDDAAAEWLSAPVDGLDD
jgi:CRP/FNR family cyclic AMP-dependent transcriptional regulator